MLNPLETPWLLLIIGIVILAIGSVVRNNVSPKKGLLLIGAGLLLTAAAFGIEYAFKTDNEQVQGLIDTCRTAVITNKPGMIGPCISQQYRDSMHPGKPDFTADAERIIRMAGVYKIRFQSITLQFTGNSARAGLNMAVFMDPKKSAFAAGGLFFVEMSIEFRKENNTGWVITSSEVESVNNERAGWNIAH
jgi:hypothetical protein